MINKEVALIIGAGDSLGSAVARVFAQNNFITVVARRNGDQLSPLKEEIEKKIVKYIGYINQIPPKVSAVKINGKRAYKLFRENKKFTIQPKKVFIKDLYITDHSINKTSFRILCGQGFYVRSLARDLAIDLKTYGHISSLKRSKVGKFSEKNSILLDDLLKIGQRHEEINCISTTISMLDDILAYEIEEKLDIENLSFGRSIKIDEKKFNEPIFSF